MIVSYLVKHVYNINRNAKIYLVYLFINKLVNNKIKIIIEQNTERYKFFYYIIVKARSIKIGPYKNSYVYRETIWFISN